MDVIDFRLSDRYRKTIDSPLLRRLCSSAWEARRDSHYTPEFLEEVRLIALRTALAVAPDDDLDVLAHYGATGIVSKFRVIVSTEGGRLHSLSGALGCQVQMPYLWCADWTIDLHSGPYTRPRNALAHWDTVPDWIGDVILERASIQIAYERENDAITAINRGMLGRALTWRQICDLIPVTGDYIHQLILAEQPIAIAA